MMIVHGDMDKTLPYEGGTGIMTMGIAKVMDTNLEKSQPHMQSKVWSEAAGGDGTITSRFDHEIFEERNYSAKNGEVNEYIVKSAGHAIHDYKNNGWRGLLWSPSYFAGSCVGAPISIIKQYIQQQQTPD